MAKKFNDWNSYLEDYYRRQREASGVTEQDHANYRAYYVSQQDGETLRQEAEAARDNLISAPRKVTSTHKALIDYSAALSKLDNYIALGGTVNGANNQYMQSLYDQYNKSWEEMQRMVQTNRQGFGNLGMQTAAGIAPNGVQVNQDALMGAFMPGRGLIDPKTGVPTEANQRAAQENAMRRQYQDIQSEAGQEAARWGAQAESAAGEKERVDKWMGIVSNLPETTDARIIASNEAWMRQAAEELGIESYTDKNDLLRKIRVQSQIFGAENTTATGRAEDYAAQQQTARAYEYQLDNPDESINANYYLALRDQAGRDAKTVDGFMDFLETPQEIGNWLRYNSAYGNQLYQDQKNEDILAIRSDPTVGPIYQEAMEAARGSGQVSSLRAQVHGEMRDNGSISPETEAAVREMAQAAGITVGQGDAALEAALEQMHQQYSHTVNTNLARLSAQGYDPERLRQYIEQALNEQRMDERNAAAREFAAERPGAASVGSSLTNVLSGGGYLATMPQAAGNMLAGITGNYDNYIPIDTNSVAFDQAQYVMNVRDEVTQRIVESGGSDFLYGFGMSMLDNVVQMAVGAMTFGLPAAAGAAGQGTRAAIQAGVQAASPVTLATMGLGAASQELVSLTEQGTPSDQAYALATVLGGLEILTEKIGIDSLVGNLGKQYAGNLVQQIVMMAAKQSAAEGMEEVIAEAGGVFADWLIRQEDSDIMQTIEAGRMNGLTESEALWGAFREYGKQVLEAGAAGALSGLGFGAASTVGVMADAVSPASTGSRIRAEGNEEALGALAQAYGIAYNPEMTDREIGRTYRAVRRETSALQRDLQQGMSMDAYAKEKGYDARTARALNRSWNAYHSALGNRMSSREFAATWNSVKAAGQANMRFEDAVAELGETSLSQRTLENAWKAGQKLYVQAQKTAKAKPVAAQEIAQQKTEATVETVAELSESAPAVTQLVERDSESAAGHAQSLMGERINVNGLSDEQVDALFDESDNDISTERRGALAMARMLTGVSKNINQVILVDNAEVDAEGHMRLSNGMWDPTNRTITIDINAGRTNVEQQATFMTRTMSHEVTHSIKTTAPKQYAELERFVLREMDKQANLEALIEAKIADYAKYGIALDRQGAVDELVAEACEQMLERTEVLNKLAQENRTLWEKIRDYIKNAIAKLKALYKGMKANSPEARMLQGVIDELQAKWDAAFEASLTVESLETENNEAMSPAQEIQHSLARNEELSELARVVNEKDGFVAARTLSNATSDRQKIADMMRENIDKYGNSYGLPPDLEGDTFLADGSYSGSEENSTICVRSMAHEAMLDSVSELLGRPLTVQESIFVGQDLLTRTNIGMRMECTYCYVATDRKGYREFLAKYLQQRDAVLEKYRNGMTDTSRTGKLYKDFLNKRKDTDNMWDRFSMWIELEKNGAPMMKSSDLANVAKMIRGDYDQELKPQIEDAMKYAQGASWAKKRMSYTAYNGHILKWTLDKINALNSHYGLRMYSFSDFSPAFILENMQMFVDAAVRGLKVLAYTKELDFVKIFAKTGANINISCFGMDVGGNVVEDSIQGAAWEEAQKLRAKHPNVGITFVATNDALVEWALAQEWIDVVIPFHLVRTGKELAKQLGFEDYTKESSDKKVRGKHISQKKAAALGIEADENSISPVEHDNDFDKYMAALKENHLRPRFERWINNPNYMKLVNECRQSASESQPVQPVFDLEAAKDSLNSLIGQGGYYVPYGGSVERQYELATDIADKISAGEATAAAKKAQVEWDEKHPKKPRKSKVQHQVAVHTEMDRAYAEALNFGNMDAAQRLVEQAAATAGYWRSRWHETKPESDFHVFNINRADNASADNQTPYGIFTKAHDRTVGLGGKQMRLFVRADRILRFRDRDTMKQQMPEEYKALLRRLEEVDAKYGAEAEEMEDQFFWDIEEWLEAQPNEDELRERIDPAKPFYESIGDAMPQELIDLETRMTLHSEEWHEAENVEILAAKEWLTKWLPANGYDAMELEYDNGAGDRVTDALIVLSEDQVKLADVITRDDDGNIIPLSERFKAGNKDIRYQISRDTASDMDLLMGASMDGLSKAEADHLLRYRDRVNEIRQNQRKIDELKAEELTADINAQIKRLENANSIIYRKVNAAEQTDLMQRIIERERAAGDVEVQRMDNRVADLEDEIDELEQKIRNAKLAGQMGQGRRDAATLRKTEERLTKRNEKQKQAANEKAAKQKQRDAERLDAQKQKYSDKLKEQRTQAKQAATDARLAGQMEQGRRDAVALQRTVEEYEARLESKRRELRIARESRERKIAQMQESRVKSMDSRHRTQMRHKIRKVVKELDALLLRGTKDRNIRDEMKAAVASALEAINMDSGDYEGRIAKLDEAIAAATDPVVIATLTESRERIAEQGSNMRARLSEMKTAYSNFSKDTSGNYNSMYDDVVQNYIDATIEKVGKTPLWDMSMEQLESVYNMYRMILTDIQQANKLVRDEKNRTIYSMGDAVIRDLDSKKRRDLMLPGSKKMSQFAWNTLKPVYAFDTIGSNTLNELYDAVRGGEDTWAKDTREAQAFYFSVAERYNVDEWDVKTQHEFTSRSGKRFSLGLEQIMSLYAYSKRDQAEAHLEKGGFVFDSSIRVVKKVKGIPVEYEVNTKQAHGIDPLTLNDIIATLTDEQRSFVDEMQAYLSDTMGAKGNEVSLDMYGVRLFNEQNYFPLKTSKQFLFEQNEVAGEVKLKNSGFSKHTTPQASNPIILSNFMDVWGRHINDMSMYHAFVIPLENFNRVYNYQTLTTEESEPDSVKGTISDIYGDAPVNYIKQLLTDLNGGVRVDPTTSIIDWGLAKFKSASVMASLSVIIQQPSSIVRAFALIDPKYFVSMKGMKHKALWEELKEYVPVATIKEMGRFDTHMGRSTSDWIQNRKPTGVKESAKRFATDSEYRSDFFSRPAALMDELTWCRIWTAVKAETKDKTDLRPGTKEFYDYCGKRCTEIITRTQVYDSVLSRSAMMRSKDTGMKMATAFMAEPTTSMNMVVSAINQVTKGYVRAAGKTFGAVVGSLLFNSILVSLVYAMRDDDEDENYLEKYFQALSERLKTNAFDILLLNSTPFLRDIVSIFQGYDVERTDMSLVGDIYTALENLKSETATPYDKVMGIAEQLARFFGLPLKNIRRDAEGIYNSVMTLLNENDYSFGDVKEGFYEGWTGEELSSGSKLYEAYITGDDAAILRLEADYQEAFGEDWYKEIQSDLRAHVKELYLDGDLSDEEATNFLIEYAIELTPTLERQHDAGTITDEEYMEILRNEAYWLIKGWNTRAEDSDASTARYADLRTVIEAGGDATAAMEELLTHGETEEDISSNASSIIADLYKNGEIDEATAREYLAEYAGIEDSKKLYTWFVEKDHWVETGENDYGAYGPVWDALIEGGDVNGAIDAMVKAGWTEDAIAQNIRTRTKEWVLGTASDGNTITPEEARNILSNYGGVDAEDLDAYVAAYNFWLDNPEYVDDFSVEQANDYLEYGTGIDIGMFLDFREAKSGMVGKKDANGETISGSVKAEAMAYIDALPITNAQKDQLYLMYWSETKIYEAPWH